MSSRLASDGTLQSDRTRTVKAGGITVFTWQQGNFQYDGQVVTCNQASSEAQFTRLGIRRAEALLCRDNVTSIIYDVVESARKDEHFNSHVRTYPGHIVTKFIRSIVESNRNVGYRYPQGGDHSNLAEVDLETGIIWFNQRLVEIFAKDAIRLMTEKPEKNQTLLNQLLMSIVVPAIHGWSRILAYKIMRGDFDDLPHAETQVKISKRANEILGSRLYTFSEDERENTMWLAEAFGDYVIELLFRGEFSIREVVPDPPGAISQPALYSTVDRRFGIKKPSYYRLDDTYVDVICGHTYWPHNSNTDLQSRVRAKTSLVGDLDTVRKKKLRASVETQVRVDQFCNEVVAWGRSGWEWMDEVFPDYVDPTFPAPL